MDIPVAMGVAVYVLLWLVLYLRHKGDKDVDLAKHSLSLLGVVFTLVNSVFFFKAILFPIPELKEFFYAPTAAFGFALVSTLGWAGNLWRNLWKKESSIAQHPAVLKGQRA